MRLKQVWTSQQASLDAGAPQDEVFKILKGNYFLKENVKFYHSNAHKDLYMCSSIHFFFISTNIY